MEKEVNGRIVVIWAEWSQYDVQLISELNRSKAGDSHHLQIIEVAAIKTMSDLEKVIPGIGNVWQTPAVGIWENEVLMFEGQGFNARQKLLSKF